MKRERALVVFSGGQDSTTCLAKALLDYGDGNVACITFHYGQRHCREVDVARQVAVYFGVADHKFVNLGWYSQVTDSALFNPQAEIGKDAGDICPNTVVDGRNMLFLLVAAVYAKSKGIHDIITGVSETDFSGYPDCREVFVKSCNETLNLAMDYEFRVVTPLMGLTKAETWALADRLGVLDYVAANTLTCYNDIVGAGCGVCPSCRLRNKGLEEYLHSKEKRC